MCASPCIRPVKELEWALQSLRPKWVISTTPPCLAMELAYVKNHCFKTRLSPNDPLWKLLELPKENPTATTLAPPAATIEAMKNTDDDDSCVDESASDSNQVQERAPIMLKDLGIKAEQPVTLFGRARFGPLQESELWKDDKCDEGAEAIEQDKFEAAEQDSTIDHAPSNACTLEDNIRAESKQELSSADASTECDVPSENGKNSEVTDRMQDVSCIGSSKNFNATLRKLYRSMNVPVPRPLPSLAELMRASKRVIAPFVQL